MNGIQKCFTKKIGISRTNFAAVAMEIKSGDFNIFFISFIKLHKNDHSRLLAKQKLMKPSTQKAAIHYSGYSYKVS
jgi:hypothetical protein